MKKKLQADLANILDQQMRSTRIGTCYNAFTKELIVEQNSIDLGKLNEQNKLMFVDGIAKFKLSATANNSASENSSKWGLDTKVSGGIWKCKASAGFKMEKSHADSKATTDVKANVSYKYQEQFFRVQRASEKVLFKCMTEDFQDAYTAIMKAATPIERVKKYQDFIQQFGTGCVTKLYLEAGSIADIKIESVNTANSNSAKYEANVAVSSSIADVSAAGGWAEEHKTAGLKGEVKITAVSYPQNAPTKEWVKSVLDTFNGKAIDELTKGANFASLPEVKFDPAPPYPEKEKPEEKELPENKSDFDEEMKKKIMEEDGYEGSWDDYVKKQEEALAKITNKDVVKDAQEAVSNLHALPASDDRPKMFAKYYNNNYVNRLMTFNSGWDLGGYMPIDFEVTPWEELFPSLKAPFQCTSSSIYLAKLMTFYYTRLQFGQYLSFLKDTGDAYESHRKDQIPNDVSNYFLACKKYLEDMIENLPEKATEQDYKRWLSCFDNYLESKDYRGRALDIIIQFFNKEIYQSFFKHYDVLSRCPYGLTYHFNAFYDPIHYDCLLDFKIDDTPERDTATGYVTKNLGLKNELQKALRFYPVLEVVQKQKAEGGYEYPVMVSAVYFKNGQFHRFTLNRIDVYVKGKSSPKDDVFFAAINRLVSFPDWLLNYNYDRKSFSWYYKEGQGRSYYVEDTGANRHCVDFKIINTLAQEGGVKMRGVQPMFQDFPFSLAKGYPA